MSLKKIAVFCSGNGSNFEAILKAIDTKKLRAEAALMVCDNPKAFAIRRAARAGVPVVVISPKLFESRAAYEKFIVRILKTQAVEYIVLAGFMRILTPYFIREYKGKILNIHPSLLPDFKGAHAIRDAFEAGAAETGVSVHVVTDKLDSGPVIVQKKIKISKHDSLESLENKIHRAEHQIYPAAIQKYMHKGRK